MKFFVWPLGVWLAATAAAREALVAAVVGGASLLLVLPFTSLADIPRDAARLGRHLRPAQLLRRSASLVQTGAPDWLARDRRPSSSAPRSSCCPGGGRASPSPSPPRSCCRRSSGSTTSRSRPYRSPSCGRGSRPSGSSRSPPGGSTRTTARRCATARVLWCSRASSRSSARAARARVSGSRDGALRRQGLEARRRAEPLRETLGILAPLRRSAPSAPDRGSGRPPSGRHLLGVHPHQPRAGDVGGHEVARDDDDARRRPGRP